MRETPPHKQMAEVMATLSKQEGNISVSVTVSCFFHSNKLRSFQVTLETTILILVHPDK